MGGFGSGSRWSKKACVEGCTALDTSALKRMKLLVPGTANRAGSLEWRRAGEDAPSSSVNYILTVGSTTGALRLIYTTKSTASAHDYTIALVATGCQLGGVRWWFVCPLTKNGIVCERRVRKVYLYGRYFGCRHCHNLTYRSQQDSDSRVYALARLGLDAMPRIEGASVTQLGISLRALTVMHKRVERSGNSRPLK